ncbi:aminotransferase class IV [Polluticaenibacter yanchengensis]|uniref:PorT family protein n=1 Tax=Polluticaenibacter yanchengensis TaxID=3014562 RepID=A0ABT4UGK2_9BACT|nr:hypothetical protein [Chitinophagaceae bacterium LY-5]
MRYLLVLFILAMSNVGICQMQFEKGYFVDNAGVRTECLVKKSSWSKNPVFITYKLNDSDKFQSKTIDEIAEFGIDGQIRFLRQKVWIDISSTDMRNLENDFEPIYQSRVVLLEQLIDGNASLYMYTDNNDTKFFLKRGADTIVSLVEKMYLVENARVVHNETYKQQLKNELTCLSLNADDVKKIHYNKKDLVRIVNKYNNCVSGNQQSIVYEVKKERKLAVNFAVRPRANFSTVKLHQTYSNLDFNFNSSAVGLGLEGELSLPFAVKNLRVLAEPTFQYFKKSTAYSKNYNAVIHYKSLELPIGIRYYIDINEKSTLFINALYMFDFGMNSHFEIKEANYRWLDLDIKSKGKLAFGGGFSFKNKHKIELRYITDRDIQDHTYFTSKYNSISLVYGYTIFKK